MNYWYSERQKELRKEARINSGVVEVKSGRSRTVVDYKNRTIYRIRDKGFRFEKALDQITPCDFEPTVDVIKMRYPIFKWLYSESRKAIGPFGTMESYKKWRTMKKILRSNIEQLESGKLRIWHILSMVEHPKVSLAVS